MMMMIFHDIYIFIFLSGSLSSGRCEVECHRHRLVNLPGHWQVNHGRHKAIIVSISGLHFLLTFDEEGLHDVIGDRGWGTPACRHPQDFHQPLDIVRSHSIVSHGLRR